jgi:hypothetical protein
MAHEAQPGGLPGARAGDGAGTAAAVGHAAGGQAAGGHAAGGHGAGGQGGGHGGGTRAIIAALLANLGIAFTKFVAYFLTSSSSMLAEGVHSLADSGNQLLLLIGGR